jgi:hypothetical protein
MVSGTKVGWMVVGVVCLVTTLSVLAVPPTIGQPAWREVPPASTSPQTFRAGPMRERVSELSDAPTVVRLEASEPSTVGPIRRVSESDVELTSHSSPLQAATSSEPRPRDPYATTARQTGSAGNRLLRSLFPHGSSLIAPPRPELPPPSLSLPAEMGRTLR